MKVPNAIKILIVTNAYPSKEKQFAGIFVKNQYLELKRLKSENEKIEIFYMSRKITSVFGSILKYFKFLYSFFPKFFSKYDVIHLHFFYPLIFLVFFYKCIHPRTKLIVTFHGSDINIHVNNWNKHIFRIVAKKIDIAIPVGNYISKQIIEKLRINTSNTLPVGINRKVFYQDNSVQKIYDLIFVGSFIEVKGIDRLYELILKLDKKVKICIVGKGNEYESKFLKLKDDGHTNITIKIDQTQTQLMKLYNQSKFLILLSRSEGFPTVSIESMFCGTPVIASDIPQFKEQIQEGINGFIVSKTVPQELYLEVKKILNISEEQYQELSKGAVNSHRELELSNICRQLLNLYRF